MATKWTEEDMIAQFAEDWEVPEEECEVREGDDYLFVYHPPTGHTSTEAGNGGKWHLDGTAF